MQFWKVRGLKYPEECVDNYRLLLGFDWAGLPAEALVVDVGGGIGAQSMTLAKNIEHLRFIVQDREPVLKDAVGV